MTIRVEVQPDCTIEIMRPRNNGRAQFITYPTIERALIVIRLFMEMELAEVAGARFVPAFVKEARRAFKQLQEKSPYGKPTTTKTARR